ncbi:MAG: response regulator transcription factor [Sandaracinaceae bacterium]
MGDGPRILLVEDDPSIALGLCDTLEFEGFEVQHARTGQEGIAAARKGHPDCIILDLMLPDTNGYRVCEQIREGDAVVPIIMLTARSQEADKIRGLDAGADDYVTKPFSVGELVARIRAIFRRTQRGTRSDAPIEVGDAVIDPDRPGAAARARRDEALFLRGAAPQAAPRARRAAGSRDEILDKVWGIEGSPSNRTVDNFVVKLRKKIEPKPEEPRHILTVYGVGYKLVV